VTSGWRALHPDEEALLTAVEFEVFVIAVLFGIIWQQFEIVTVVEFACCLSSTYPSGHVRFAHVAKQQFASDTSVELDWSVLVTWSDGHAWVEHVA